MTEQMERPENLDVHAKIFGNANDEQPGFALYARWAKVLEVRIAVVEAEHYSQLGSNECTCGEAAYPCSDIRILRGEGVS